MTTKPFFVKDPDAESDYAVDWKALTNTVPGAINDWLAVGETISTYNLTVPSDLTLLSQALQFSDTRVVFWLAGGLASQRYTVSCRITTSAARKDERSIWISMTQR